jgi:hypothetical protein
MRSSLPSTVNGPRGLPAAYLEREVYELTYGDPEVIELVYVETEVRRDADAASRTIRT